MRRMTFLLGISLLAVILLGAACDGPERDSGTVELLPTGGATSEPEERNGVDGGATASPRPTPEEAEGPEMTENATATPAPDPAEKEPTRSSATPAFGALTPLPTIVKEEPNMTPAASPSRGLQGLVDQAKADLVDRLFIDPDQIEVVEVRAVVWPDGSLGCPQPGMAYIQVQREGLLIRLRVDKRLFSYHSGGGRPPFLCEDPIDYDKLPSSPGFGIE